jgi:adenylosuccinate lyase
VFGRGHRRAARGYTVPLRVTRYALRVTRYALRVTRYALRVNAQQENGASGSDHTLARRDANAKTIDRSNLELNTVCAQCLAETQSTPIWDAITQRAEMESEDKNEDKKAGLSVHVRGRILFNCD